MLGEYPSGILQSRMPHSLNPTGLPPPSVVLGEHSSGILQSQVPQSGILQVASHEFQSWVSIHLGSYSLGSYRSQATDLGASSVFIGILLSGILQVSN